MFFLIGNLYSSQVELRQNADARLVSIGEARAAEIGDFLIERRQAAARLAASEDISNYFSNLDLGMSVKYGLFANLAAIERRFQATMDDEKYQGQPAYLRLAFFDRNGVAQVDVGAPGAPTPSLTDNPAEPSIQIDEKRRLIVASAPVLQKGKLRGAVETVSNLNLLASLVSSQRPRAAARIPAGRRRRGSVPDRAGALTHCRPGPRAGRASVRPHPGPVKFRSARTEGISRAALADCRHPAFYPAAGERGRALRPYAFARLRILYRPLRHRAVRIRHRLRTNASECGAAANQIRRIQSPSS